jgi:putative transposase
MPTIAIGSDCDRSRASSLACISSSARRARFKGDKREVLSETLFIREDTLFQRNSISECPRDRHRSCAGPSDLGRAPAGTPPSRAGLFTAGPSALPTVRASRACERSKLEAARPVGPTVRSPGRKAGVRFMYKDERRRRGTFRQEFLDHLVACSVMSSVAGKYLCVNLHLVWSTKQRRSLIDRQWRDRLHAYVASVAQSKNARVIEAQSQPDHIHLYVSMPSTTSIADLVNATKSNSTRWIRQTFSSRRFFGWQDGYAAFSVSKSMEKAVIDYIRNQDEHHKKRDFQQELLELLGRHAIDFDARYIFD